ncbi:MAG: hypothetical protein AB8F74_10315 [Saprospiraceae bacterium]
MIDLFQKFNEEQAEILVDSIPLITILIAGADGNIDEDERTWGEKLTKIRSYSYPELLNDFYKRVGETYSEKMDAYIASLPKETDARTAAVSEKLEKLNGMLAQLDQHDGHTIYKSLTSFAEHVAKASGGFLRIGAISSAEAKLINLPMLTPIEEPEEEA